MSTAIKMVLLGGLVMLLGVVFGAVLLATDVFGLFNITRSTRSVSPVWPYVLPLGYLFMVAQIAIGLMAAMGWWGLRRCAAHEDATPS